VSSVYNKKFGETKHGEIDVVMMGCHVYGSLLQRSNSSKVDRDKQRGHEMSNEIPASFFTHRRM
jgi:hypothetical protein